MKIIRARLANTIWILLQSRESKKFHKNCFHLIRAQQRKLKNYVSKNKNTQFGILHKFHEIKDYNSYKVNVPIQEWSDIAPWVEVIKNGEYNVLTKEKVVLFEETSGTSSFSKLIPYTNSLKKEIQKGVGPWMKALHTNYKSAFNGSSYWSISPPLKERKTTSSGIPIGIQDDTEYFNPVAKYLLSKILAVPTHLKQELHSETFYFQTFEYLLMKDNLSFISVWSPTFFLELNQFLITRKNDLISSLKSKYSIENSRLIYLEKVMSTNYSWKDLWPDLTVISCWRDAQSSLWIDQVQDVIGNVYIQGKGLLSTEGICSVPILKEKSPVLCVQSHFYEFRTLHSGKVLLAHNLNLNEIYELIITTSGGLYRYATGDLIEVDGYYGYAPTFKFVGRKNNSSDLVGEKLSEVQVIKTLNSALKDLSTKIELAFVYPVINDSNHRNYRVYLEPTITFKDEITQALDGVAENTQRILMNNPHYKTAIDLNQLMPVEAHILECGFKHHLFNYYTSSFGIKDGDLKIPVLFKIHSLESLLDI